MKHIIMITGIFAFICILFTSGDSSEKTRENKAAYYSNFENSLNYKLAENEDNDKTYTLKEYRSKLAVFYEKNSLPFYVTNVLVSELPKADRDALQKGITVKTRRELDRLIEDYCS